MAHWLDWKIGVQAPRIWTDEEIDLLLSGQPVPYRTDSACAYRRRKLGILSGPAHHLVKAPYEPPTPVPGKIPWPSWWRRAHLMRVEGRQATEIARLLGQDVYAVRGALYAKAHESHLRSSRRRKQTPASLAKQQQRRQVRDRERDKLRELARFE
jgi:hypothetical protein